MDSALTRQQLAKELSLSTRQIARYEEQGLPVMKLGHRTVRYNLAAVLAWMQQRGVKAEALKAFKVTSDTHDLTGSVYVVAQNETAARILIDREYFYMKLDDELSDLYDIEEVTEPQILKEEAV
jgi:phage terminase Nu1 subunit (DNA packaging protein)